ncbi:MAG TPA: hypothetical protein VI819_04365 [Patescibacteria group bacterium]|nr:hypothetical protein [Patescibacteria group bacterium]
MNGKIKHRKTEVKLRKNFLPTLIVTLLLWLGVFSIIYWVDPFATWAIFLFFINIFFAIFFTLSIVFANTRRGLLGAIVLLIFLVLRYFELGHLVNFFLLAGIAITAEIYILRRNS